MSLRETWSDLDTIVKVLVGVAVFVVAIPVVLITVAVLASFVLGTGGGEAVATPSASFSVQYDTGESMHEATVTHDAGDPIQASNLAIEVGSRTEGWADADGEVTRGDTATVSVSPETEFAIVWNDGDGHSSTMFEFESPPAAGS